MQLTIPSSPKVAPQDILDQVVVVGQGGNNDEPEDPIMHYEDDVIYLKGFRPNEEIRLVAYKRYDSPDRIMFQYYYVTDWILNTDKNGELTINITNYQKNKFEFNVLNPDTGKRITGSLFAPSNLCADNTTTRLEVGDLARVTITNGIPVRLRTSPYLDSKIKAEIDEGEEMKVLDGPACSDKLVWWYVNVDGTKGWMAEGDGNKWFLEPWT